MEGKHGYCMNTEAAGRRVVVVDDHTFYRDGLVGLLRDSGVDVVADVPNGEAALDIVPKLSPDVVVMDLSMPGLGGVETTRRLVAQTPGCRVLVLTVSQEEEDILNAVLAGASGFVLKDGPIEDVVDGIDSVVAGQPYFSERVAAQLLRHLKRTGEKSSPLNRLHPREIDILTRLAAGSDTKRIAADIGISEQTVRQHVSAILLKLRAESRGEIAVGSIRDRIV